MCICDTNVLSIVRGTNAAFALPLTKNGEPYFLSENEVLVFGLKRSDRDEESVLTKKITHCVNGEYYLELEPKDTESLSPGRYFYDVGLQQGDSVFYNVIQCKPFIIISNCTKLGDGA